MKNLIRQLPWNQRRAAALAQAARSERARFDIIFWPAVQTLKAAGLPLGWKSMHELYNSLRARGDHQLAEQIAAAFHEFYTPTVARHLGGTP